jgi:pyruvate dehydrogenase (quinone)
MLGLGDLLTQVQRKTKVLHIIFNNESLNFVGIEQQEAGFVPSVWISRIRTWPR